MFLSYICMPVFIHTFLCVFFIHLHAGFCHTFVCDFVCVFLSFICMRVFYIYLYAYLYVGFFHTFVYLYSWQLWLNGEFDCPTTRGLAIESPLTAQQKDWWADSQRGGSSPCHGWGALGKGTVPPCSLGAVISCPSLQYMSIFFSYICMPVFSYFCIFFSYICMPVFSYFCMCF